MNRNDGVYIFKQIKELVEEEVKRSRNLILKFDESDMDCRQTKMATFSRINRIHLIINFLKKLTEEFSIAQQNLYKDYEDCAQLVLKQFEEVKEQIQYYHPIEKEN